MLDPAAGYAAATDEAGELVGFFCFGAGGRVPGGERAGVYAEDAVDVGLGLRPDLTGRGLGGAFVAAGLAHGRAVLTPPPTRFRLSVAAFNERAIRVYERAGFRAGPRFTSPVGGVEVAFVLMVKEERETVATGRGCVPFPETTRDRPGGAPPSKEGAR